MHLVQTLLKQQMRPGEVSHMPCGKKQKFTTTHELQHAMNGNDEIERYKTTM